MIYDYLSEIQTHLRWMAEDTNLYSVRYYLRLIACVNSVIAAHSPPDNKGTKGAYYYMALIGEEATHYAQS